MKDAWYGDITQKEESSKFLQRGAGTCSVLNSTLTGDCFQDITAETLGAGTMCREPTC